MKSVEPLKREDLPDFEGAFQATENALGFLPNSLLTLARVPELLGSFCQLMMATMTPRTVDGEMKAMVSHIASNASGCRYCQAHTIELARRGKVAPDKLAKLWEFESSPVFSAAERAALRLARDAATSPSSTTPEHFVEARKHWSDEQIVEIMGVVALFGFLNRYNDAMGTQLEPVPTAAAKELLGKRWEIGKHA